MSALRNVALAALTGRAETLIVEQAGGRVWCESEEWRGAVFAFTRPAGPEGASAS